LDGMELENNDPFMPGSHWEKRLVGNEYMSPIGGPQIFVSRLTLSLFEDMGWYRANYSKADGNRWGYHQGCDFVDKSCGSLNWGRYFCDYFQGKSLKCNGDQTALGYCDLKDWRQPLGYRYQYFTDHPTWGGSQNFGDYCPIVLGFSNTYCQDVIGGALFLGDPDPSIRYGSHFSSHSACFDFIWDGTTTGDAGCYQIGCDSAGLLSVTIYGTSVQCPRAGGQVPVDIPVEGGTRVAQLKCPPADFFCAQNTSLMALGEPPDYLIKYKNHSNNNYKGFQSLVFIVSLLSLLVYQFVN